MPVYLEKTEEEAHAAAERAVFVTKGWIEAPEAYKARLREFNERNEETT